MSAGSCHRLQLRHRVDLVSDHTSDMSSGLVHRLQLRHRVDIVSDDMALTSVGFHQHSLLITVKILAVVAQKNILFIESMDQIQAPIVAFTMWIKLESMYSNLFF